MPQTPSLQIDYHFYTFAGVDADILWVRVDAWFLFSFLNRSLFEVISDVTTVRLEYIT